jgi:hypothetical protein
MTNAAAKQASHYELRIEGRPVDVCESRSDLQDSAMAAEHVGRSYSAVVVFTDGTFQTVEV